MIIVADDKAILSYDQLIVAVQKHKPGDKIDRHATSAVRPRRTATVTLGAA